MKKQDPIYHACRVAFIAGAEGVPWHMVCHALTQGLDLKDTFTYILKEKDFKEYPQLRELVEYLSCTKDSGEKHLTY